MECYPLHLIDNETVWNYYFRDILKMKCFTIGPK